MNNRNILAAVLLCAIALATGPSAMAKGGKGKGKKDAAKKVKELGLKVDGSIPLFADVTRLAEQKGVDLLHDAVLELLSSGERLQFALLGSGDPRLETALERLAKEFPESVAVRIGFDPALVGVLLYRVRRLGSPAHAPQQPGGSNAAGGEHERQQQQEPDVTPFGQHGNRTL